MEGIDVYTRNQTVTNWAAVRAADIGWCYQKVSDGTGIRSTNKGPFAGVLQGGYHFSQPGDPIAQANLLVSSCTSLGLLDLNPALDLEDNSPSSGLPNIPDVQKADWAIAFGRQVMARGHGFTLYANDSTWSFIKSKVLAALPQTFRWIARYGSAPVNPYDAWQYTSTGSVPGISAGSVDRNKGKIPLNHGGADMPLDTTDLSNIHQKVWYSAIQTVTNPNGTSYTLSANQVLMAFDASLRGLSSALQAQTKLIVDNEANDITAEALANALRDGLVTSGIADVVRTTILAVPPVDLDSFSEKLIENLGVHLTTHVS